MTIPGDALPEGAVKKSAVGEAYADIAMIDAPLSGMILSPWLMPVVALPPKPPPANSGYVPGVLGGVAAQSALNFSNVGVFNREAGSRLILKIKAVAISNISGGNLIYAIRRLDGPATGFTFSQGLPAYADAGTGSAANLGRVIRNNSAVVSGQHIADVAIPDGSCIVLPLEAVINNGSIIVAGASINQAARATFFFETFPIIHPQRAG